MAGKFTEQCQIVSGFVPVDMQTGANDGDWVSLKGYGKCAIVLFKAAGTAGDDPTVTLEQATAVDGTGAKALAKIDRVDVKQGTLTAVGKYTTVTQAAAATYTDATSAEAQAIWVIEIDAEELDVSGGFDCLRARVADVGVNAQLGCLLYLLLDPRYPGAADALESAIAD